MVLGTRFSVRVRGDLDRSCQRVARSELCPRRSGARPHSSLSSYPQPPTLNHKSSLAPKRDDTHERIADKTGAVPLPQGGLEPFRCVTGMGEGRVDWSLSGGEAWTRADCDREEMGAVRRTISSCSLAVGCRAPTHLVPKLLSCTSPSSCHSGLRATRSHKLTPRWLVVPSRELALQHRYRCRRYRPRYFRRLEGFGPQRGECACALAREMTTGDRGGREMGASILYPGVG